MKKNDTEKTDADERTYEQLTQFQDEIDDLWQKRPGTSEKDDDDDDENEQADSEEAESLFYWVKVRTMR